MSRVVTDQYDKLFCRCDGTAQEFEDALTPPKEITANGNATQLSIKFNKSAGFFNGTTDYVVVPDSADWDFGTGDYNVELFVNMTTVQTTYLLDLNTQAFTIYYSAGNLLIGQTGQWRIVHGWTPTANTWYHIRVRRVSGVTTLYIDGTADNSPYTGSDDIQGGTSGLYIGKQSNGSVYFAGWMKELRVIKGSSSDVTVPTAQYSSDANTKLLMHFDTPATSPLGPAIYLDGTGDYLSVPNSTDFNFAKNPFTIETYVWIPANPGTYAGVLSGGINGGAGWILYIYSDGVIHFTSSGTTDVVTSGANLIRPGAWNHIAVSRSGTGASDLRMFLNGVLVGSATGDVTLNSGGAGIVAGACYTDGSYLMTGYQREIRISDTARYTSAFTPSQVGFSVDSNTKLYIKCDQDNGTAGTSILDTIGKTVTCAADAKIAYTEDYRSCIFKDETGKFPYPVGSAKVDFFAIGSGVGYFDGSTAFLSIPDTDDVNFSNGAFTQEFYVRPSALMNYAGFFGQIQDGSNVFYFGYDKDYGKFILYGYGGTGGSTIDLRSGGWAYGIPPANVWLHVALTRSANSWTVWANGTSLGAVTNTGTLGDLTGVFRIGKGDTVFTAGLMDNIRISKGVARYTAAFNPPDDYDPVSPSAMLAFF